MKVWKYYRGEWYEIEDPMVWNEGEDSETALKRAGYYGFPQAVYGQDPYLAELYVKRDRTLPYLIQFSITDTIEYVYINDLPSLMQWLRDYTPIWVLDKIAETQDELQTLFKRAFRAWHGHDYSGICPTCDPEQWEKMQKYRQERQKKKS